MGAAAAGFGTAIVGGKLNEENAQYEAGIYDANAKELELQAQRTQEKGEKDAQKYRNQVAQMVGNQRVSMASAGIDIGTGTALAIQEETAALGAEDARTISNNAWLDAAGLRNQAMNQRKMGNARVLNERARTFTSVAMAGMSGMGRG